MEKLREFFCKGTLRGHNDDVSFVQFVKDKKFAVSGGWDGTIRFWDLFSFKEIWTYKTESNEIACGDISQDGSLIAVGTGSKIQIIDLVKREKLFEFAGHYGPIDTVAFHPNGKSIFSGSQDTSLGWWIFEIRACMRAFVGHRGWIMACTVSPDGKYLVSGGGDLGSRDYSVKYWDIVRGECIQTFIGHKNMVEGLACTSDGKNILSFCAEQPINIWDISSGKCIRTIGEQTDNFTSMAISPDDCYLLTGHADGFISVWDIESGSKLNSKKQHTERVSSVCFSKDYSMALSGSYDNEIKLWILDWELEFSDEYQEKKKYLTAIKSKVEVNKNKKFDEIPLFEKDFTKPRKIADPDDVIKKVNFQPGQEFVIKSYDWKCSCGQINPTNQEYCQKCFKLKSNQPS